MALAVLYCEVCHQNAALNDNFCAHCGIQLPTEELLIKYYFFQGYEYCMMIEFLHRFHGVSMCLRILKNRLKSLGLARKSAEYNEIRCEPGYSEKLFLLKLPG